MSNQPDSFISWLDNELAERGWNKSQLADRAELGNQTIYAIMNGTRNAGIDACVGIARAFHILPEDVLRHAGLLPPLPPAVRNERAIVTLYRQLAPEDQQTVLTIMRALPRGPAHGVRETRPPYHTQPDEHPDTLNELVARDLERRLRTMPLADQQKIFDLMKQLRGERTPGNGNVETN